MTLDDFKARFIDPLPVAGQEHIVEVASTELSEVLDNYSRFYAMFKPTVSSAIELQKITLTTHKFTRLVLEVV